MKENRNSNISIESLNKSKASLSDLNQSLKSNQMLSFDGIEQADYKCKLGEIEDQQLATRNRIYGITGMILCGLFAAVQFIICKIAYLQNPTLTGLDYTLVRSPLMVLMGLFQLWYSNVNPLKIKPECRMLLILRTVAGGIGIPMTFIGLKYLPSSKATLIINVHPLLVAILAFLLLKEILTKIDVSALFISFLGIILFSLDNTKSSKGDVSDSDYMFGIFAMFISCLSGTIVAICLRVINQHIHPAISPFYLALITMAESQVLFLCFRSLFHVESYRFEDICLFAFSSVFDYLCQLSKSIAYKYESASIVTPFIYFQMIFMLIADILIFDYSFTLFDILGGLLVIFALLFPICYKIFTTKEVSKQKPLLEDESQL